MKRSFVLALLIVPFVFVATAAPSAQPEIVTVHGNVLYNGRPADTGLSLSEHDTLRNTGSETSYVDVAFPEGHRIRFRNAHVEFESLGNKLTLDLSQGKMFPAIQPDTSYRRNVKIKTPQAIMGIRGTKFLVEASQTETYTCVCEGAVTLQRRGFWDSGIGREIVVRSGYDFHLYEDRPLATPRRNNRMVTITWDEFDDMGYPVPDKYRGVVD